MARMLLICPQSPVGDGNGRSHVKAALVGPPDHSHPGRDPDVRYMAQIVLLELDVNAGREREIVCTVTGEV